jgi:chromosome segregation ATPase
VSDIFGDTTRAELQQEIDRLRADLAQRTAEVAALKAEVSRISLRWEIADHRVSLLWADRDEARREACVSEARYSEERAHPLDIPREEWIQRDARSIAVERGWDCFDAKEES